MGFLDNTSVTVDAILTKLGRERLSQGAFRVTRFALSDEEIDYRLYDVSHPNGTDSYGSVIENMNLLEALPNKAGFMSHLIDATLAGSTLNVGQTQYSGLNSDSTINFTPKTIGGAAESYTVMISNRNYFQFTGLGRKKSHVFASGTTVNIDGQIFGTPDIGTSTIEVTGNTSGLVQIITASIKFTVGGEGDGEGSDGGDGDGNNNGTQTNSSGATSNTEPRRT